MEYIISFIIGAAVGYALHWAIYPPRVSRSLFGSSRYVRVPPEKAGVGGWYRGSKEEWDHLHNRLPTRSEYLRKS